ncbi:MAG: endolytic transglycosylase MltG [Hyphomicrobiaceae bacterium]
MRWLNGFLTFILAMMAVAAGSAIWFSHQVDRTGPLAEVRLISIQQGKGTRAIATQLETAGLISSRHIFLAHQIAHNMWERAQGRVPQTLKAGDYQLKPGASVREIASVIRGGKAVLISVPVPEGLTSHQVVQRLRANDQLTGEIETPPPEGFLLPDTYRVPIKAERNAVLGMMAREQRKFLSKVWEERRPDLPYKDVSEALIMASLVEKETGPKDDPARIAGVFVNRLRKGMRLQSDPTILYGKFGSKVNWGSKIFRSDIQKKTTHNTYQIDGLPPTPICNPGRASIAAALNPADTKDLYFVANGKGGHIFSETVQQHNRAVAQWRKIEREIRAAEKAKAQLPLTDAVPKAQVVVATTNAEASPQARATPQAAAAAAQPQQAVGTNGVPLPQRKPQR